MSVVDRQKQLHEAALALNSELSLDALLQKLVEIAASLTGARYAALGVIDPSGAGLERFLTTGVDEETHRAIGDLPRGRGILGVLIREAEPLRLHDIADDPRSVGFPQNHPPMSTFLGVPILLRGVAYGNLYLTEKEGGDFTQEDQDDVMLLATHAAVAIENARLYESATTWSRQLESVNEIAAALAQEVELAPLLQLIAERLRGLIDSRVVAVALPQPDGTVRVEASAGAELAGVVLGVASKTARVLERRRSERVDSVIDDPEVDVAFSRRHGVRAALWVPLLVGGRAIGILFALDKNGADPRFSDDDLRLAESFARRAAVAVERSERVARDSLRRVVEAQEQERRRLALELHDETGQALTSVLLGLRGLEGGASQEQLDGLRELVVDTLRNVRRLAVELRPSALDDFGLVPALERLVDGFAERTGIAVDLDAALGDERLPRDVETAFYRIVQEALTNVARHAGATRVDVVIRRAASSATLVVEDDGSGFDPETASRSSLGLVGMRERVGLLDGRFAVESSPGVGTTIRVEVPL